MLLLVGSLLLFPPLFVLGPLAGLLAASRPRSVREWCWIAAAVLWVAVSLRTPSGLALQTIYAWALSVTGAFVLLMLVGNFRVVTGSMLAVTISFVLVTAWLLFLGHDWHTVERALGMAMRDWASEQPDVFGNKEELQSAVQVFTTGMSGMLPALLVVSILPGLAVAWSWYRRLATTPTGAPAQRFAEFRFSDQWIWGVVIGLVALVLPIPAPFDLVVGNLALVVGLLYLARGAAVVWSRNEGLPAVVLVLLLVLWFLFLPITLGASFALGVADTWVDFRRRWALLDQTRE